MATMKKNITMRRSLLYSFLLLILILSVLLLTSTIFIGYRIANQLSVSFFNHAIVQTNSVINSVTTPVLNALHQTKKSFETGLLDVNDTEDLNHFFAPIMDQIPYITSINTGDEDGNGYLILKSKDSWRNRLVRPARWGSDKVQWIRFNLNLEFQEKQMQDLDHDPRERPWYKKAVNSKDITTPAWTQPYIFHTTNEPGVTVSIQIFPLNKQPFVLAFDMKNKDLSSFSTGFRPSPNGKIFVMLDNEKVTALPSDPRFTATNAIDKYLLKDVKSLGIDEITHAVESWKNVGKPDGTTFKVSSDGDTWWCVFAKLNSREDNPSWVCTLIPESDILGNVTLQFLIILAIAATSSIIAVIMALVLSRKYTEPIHGLVQQAQSLRQLDVGPQKKSRTTIREIHHLTEANERMRIALDAFSRYIPIDIVRQLLDRGEAAKIGGRTLDVTILFTDIEGFTSISEKMPPMELALHMEEYFNFMLEELRLENATVDKFIGDSIMAFWGAPTENTKHAASAVRAVWNCTQKLNEFNKKWKDSGKPEFITRFGLASGEAVVGNVGASSRLNYTVLGDNVNLASRIEGLNKFYGTRVLATSATVLQSKNDFMYRHVDRVAVKGKVQVDELFELLGPYDQVPEDIRLFKARYEEALNLYFKQDFSEAIKCLDELTPLLHEDRSVQRLKDSCDRFIKTAPGKYWKGVHIFNR